jgi:predicted nucleotidyltransferase
MNLKALEELYEVLSIVLFGSTARRDADQYSDKDIFIMCRDLDIENLIKIKEDFIVPAIGYEEGISCYRREDVLLMAQKGSLFLWHLKLQGKVLFSKKGSFENIIANLKPYKDYEKDLSLYKELLSDVSASFQKRKTISEFDISVLFTIVRNVCILLCYHEATPKFGRSNAYIKVRGLFAEDLPLEETIFPKLCSCKLWYERAIKPERDLIQDFPIQSALEQIECLIDFAMEKCK